MDKQISRVARQAHDVYKQHGCRWNTYFYKVVLAGNDDVIKQVVTYMENNEMTETLDWLFQRNAFEETRHEKQRRSQRVFMMRIIMFILFTIINIVLTPCFYALHILSTSFLNRKQRRISASIRLPLAYAAFSQRKEMIAFFLSQGVDTDQVDHRGNNVFHYIADLSAVASDKAIQIFHNIVTQTGVDFDDVEKMLIHDRNSAGLTAVEYATKFGSPALLRQILKQPNLMHRTPFSASTHHLNITDGRRTTDADQTVRNSDLDEKHAFESNNHDDETYETEAADLQDEETSESAAHTRVELVDVTMYEAGSIADQSTLLNILSDRDVASMSRSDLEIFNDDEFIGKWLVLKCKQMIAGVASVHFCDIFMTCIIVFVFSRGITGGKSTNFFEWTVREHGKVQLVELQAWATNTSKFLKPHVFHKRVDEVTLRLQRIALKDLWNDIPSKLHGLLNITSLDHIVVPGANPLPEWSNLNAKDMDILYEQAKSMPEFSDNMITFRAARLFPHFVEDFAAKIYKNKQLFQGANCVLFNHEQVEQLYNNFTFDEGVDVMVRPNDFDFLKYFIELLCPSIDNFEQNDLNVVSDLPFSKYREAEHFDVCSYELFNENIQQKTCKSADTLLNGFINMSTHTGDELVSNLKQLIQICIYIYIILDIIERCVFLSNSVVYQTSMTGMILSALGQKVPGSYMRKQLNILSLGAVLVNIVLTKYAWNIARAERYTDVSELYSFLKLVNMACIVAIVVRFIMHIHSLRLLPGIGHFVICTFMMGTNLLHFSAVFGIVVLIFSTLFNMLIDNPDCPLEKQAGFETLIDSIFSTFQLTFGHGDMDPFFSSTPVKLTYVLYVVIVGLLLLNLIITIMSSTATEIMADPWRDVLWKIEWLDEATSVEFSFSVVTLPFRKLLFSHSLGYIFHRQAGYVVTKADKYNVYIECFHCPAMRD